jgi:phage terminase Nu1 subunit (DNA packaging protein)
MDFVQFNGRQKLPALLAQGNSRETELRKIRVLKEGIFDCDGTIRWLREELKKTTNSDAERRYAQERLSKIEEHRPLIDWMVEHMVRQETKKSKHNGEFSNTSEEPNSVMKNCDKG